ncbi:pentatricopeptide repeat-containing protein At2g20540-like [Argentina anserina]|uniref:pentatricopeptide repeat-containing protein At2g20540-like n=1 Tax=Argentina anserina TaxID=57926 RepID=UPI0021763D54|nr:pentatricopeptide repeat-containing protein At2g20540-like [Potentilla anserina]
MQQQWQASLSSRLASMAQTCLSMKQLKQIHARAIVSDLHNHAVVLGKMFRFAAVSPAGDLNYAHQLFDQMPQPTTFFYNLLVRGHSQSSSPWQSIRLFNRMRLNSIDPDGFTFTFLLKSRSRMNVSMEGDEIHGAALKCGFSLHLYVQNSLIHLYAGRGIPGAARRVFDEAVATDVVSWSGLVIAHVRANELDSARRVFDAMPERDVVSWTAMISAYSQGKCSREALELFWEMNRKGVLPDEVTLVSVISACTDLGDVQTGVSIHRFIEENGFAWMVSLCNALIDMYAKCGCMDQAWQLFDGMNRKSFVTWNTMISACANHGNADDAFWLFECMVSAGFPPDGITFLALLVAYTHKGLVDEGLRLFERMQREYRIEARMEHYGCVADMLGKAGRLEEAYQLISSMPIPDNDVVWGILLAACRTYGNVDMGERIVKRLVELKPDEGGYYILLRDIYVAAGRTAEANDMRQAMMDSGASKTPGRSWVGT